MLDLNYVEFINEDMAAISALKLRDAMHDIVVALGPKETIEVEEMANQLQSEYKITISPFFLDRFLEEFLKAKRGEKGAKTIFHKSDTRWLGVRDVNGTKQMRNNLLHLKPNLTKHKRRLFEEEDKKKIEDAYKAGMKDLNFTEDVIKKSLILQRPGDSEDIMKIIYTDVVFKGYYENTYDNCWKLMMLIGRNNNLDRVRGWFKLAPQSVKDEYYKAPEGQRKINYELTKPPKKDKKEKEKEKSKLDPETKENLTIVDAHLNKYKNWTDFTKDTTFRDLINFVDSMKADVSFLKPFEQFLAKIDQLNLILIKFYQVDKKEAIMFYKNIGLASFLREWENTNVRPKINDF